VVSVVVGGSRPEHLRQNAERFAAPIPAELWAALVAEGLLPG
jgi:D-threo-aldose 1-dehydrogenase